MLAIGPRSTEAAYEIRWPRNGVNVNVVSMHQYENSLFRRRYGIGDEALILVRPDGYVAQIDPGGRTLGIARQIGVLTPAD